MNAAGARHAYIYIDALDLNQVKQLAAQTDTPCPRLPRRSCRRHPCVCLRHDSTTTSPIVIYHNCSNSSSWHDNFYPTGSIIDCNNLYTCEWCWGATLEHSCAKYYFTNQDCWTCNGLFCLTPATYPTQLRSGASYYLIIVCRAAWLFISSEITNNPVQCDRNCHELPHWIPTLSSYVPMGSCTSFSPPSPPVHCQLHYLPTRCQVCRRENYLATVLCPRQAKQGTTLPWAVCLKSKLVLGVHGMSSLGSALFVCHEARSVPCFFDGNSENKRRLPGGCKNGIWYIPWSTNTMLQWMTCKVIHTVIRTCFVTCFKSHSWWVHDWPKTELARRRPRSDSPSSETGWAASGSS